MVLGLKHLLNMITFGIFELMLYMCKYKMICISISAAVTINAQPLQKRPGLNIGQRNIDILYY